MLLVTPWLAFFEVPEAGVQPDRMGVVGVAEPANSMQPYVEKHFLCSINAIHHGCPRRTSDGERVRLIIDSSGDEDFALRG